MMALDRTDQTRGGTRTRELGKSKCRVRRPCCEVILSALFSVVLVAMLPRTANATCPTFHTLTNGTSANASDVMDNFNYILGCPNFTGNVGIGTASPLFSSYSQLTVASTGAGGIVIKAGASDYSRLFFAKDDTSNVEGLIRYYHADNSMQFWTNANERMRMDGSGNVYIGSTSRYNVGLLSIKVVPGTSQGIAFQQTSDASTPTPIVFLNAAGGAVGTVITSGSATAYNTSSDQRLKENIKPSVAGLDRLMKIPVKDFNFIVEPKLRVQGFIAQELYGIYPEAVRTNGDNGKAPLKSGETPWQVDYGRLTPLLVKAVQELKAANDDQAAELTAVKAQNQDLMRRLQSLEQKVR